MRLAAYILAADPTWVRSSVLAYYAHVSRIVVSYDRNGLGWSGSPVPARRCIAALRAIDSDRKLRFVPGDFAGTHEDLMAAETAQRQAALDVAGLGADWVLQLDTDEVLPDAAALCRTLAGVDRRYEAVAWPMRVLYRRLRGGRYLEVAAEDGGLHVEYPGPVAVRAGATLHHARHPTGPVLKVPLEPPARAVVVDVAAAERAAVDVVAVERGAAPAAVLTSPASTGGGERVAAHAPSCPTATPEQVIWHNSWARSPRSVRRKVLSWGHGGPEMLEYYQHVWLPSARNWPHLRDLHPLDGPRWHHLRAAPPRPFRLARRDRPR